MSFILPSGVSSNTVPPLDGPPAAVVPKMLPRGPSAIPVGNRPSCTPPSKTCSVVSAPSGVSLNTVPHLHVGDPPAVVMP